MSVILGIDPGSRITGYGLIKSQGVRHTYLACGCIRTSGKQISDRLQQIFVGIDELIRQYRPTEVAVEEVFMHKNANAAIKLGQARGAAIVAASIHALSFSEYTARQIKLAIAGYGAAQKFQVQHMVCQLLKLNSPPSKDAADALAIAICHAHSRTYLNKTIPFLRVKGGRVK